MRATVTNRSIFMLKEMIGSQNFGWTLFDYRAVAVSHALRLHELKYWCEINESFFWRPGMSTLAKEIEIPSVENVTISEDTLCVDLSDGRSISVPLAWYPRLSHASTAERKRWRLVGRGAGIHWEDLDEDISVENLLTGKPSGESQASFGKWLAKRSSRIARLSKRTRRKARRAG
jgi:hypothetical protein